MSELISGKEAKLAWANGEIIQAQYKEHTSENCWFDLLKKDTLDVFDRDDINFRLKPRTIMIGDVEVPAPFEPKEGEDCRCYYVNTTFKDGFDWYHSSHHKDGRIVWRNMEEIKQVVAALRKLFKGE